MSELAYTVGQALSAFHEYFENLGIETREIEDTKHRGLVGRLSDGEEIVVFIYPLVHKQDNTKNYFDTRDSGPSERKVAWEYAQKNQLKYFCLGLNDQVDKYTDYVFSLECNEERIETISGTKNGSRNGPGNQIIIPNNYIPEKDFDRIKNNLDVYISVVHKDNLLDYLIKYDNRPYMNIDDGGSIESETKPVKFDTGYESAFSRNRILFGAPGTGKSYTLNQDRLNLLGEDSDADYERVTFHPDYSYANFVGTYKPVPHTDSDGKDSITYEYVPGPFMRIFVEALKNSMTNDIKPFLLIIEEINRANVAAVFGDIFQLLDRDDDGVSEYPIQASEDIKKYLAGKLGALPQAYTQIRIPDNMFIWATMNSADQGVFPMDTAFKRRWDFTYLGIDDNADNIRGKYIYLGEGKSQKVEWNKLRKAINRFLANEKINEDKQLGPYFISKTLVAPLDSDEIDREEFIRVFKNKVIMYLFEDAAKQKRSKLFEGCSNGYSRYSEICKEFDKKGIGIFNRDIQIDAGIEIS